MPDIKGYSTGRLGNSWGVHPNTDHVNTKGLDFRGLPGVEAYIDEDIVRAYDDNRPLLNLLANDDQVNRAIDAEARSRGINALMKNDFNDWKLSIVELGHYTDPADFSAETVVTPFKVGTGVAYAPDSGYIATGYKKLVGFKKGDGTSLWVDEHEWYYTTTPLVDDIADVNLRLESKSDPLPLGVKYILDNSIDFLTKGVQVGDYVVASDPVSETKTTARVTNIPSAHRIDVNTAIFVTAAGTPVNYSVYKYIVSAPPYAGFYRPIYTDVPESSLPSNFDEYEITVRQLYSTGAVYSFPIYLKEDLVVPFSSSVFTISNEVVDFTDSEYPGYNHYPDSFFQLETAGLGVLEIGEDAIISKNIKRREHKLLASQFNLESAVYKAELQEDAYRLNKSAQMSRIENDTNFIRVVTGVKYYNQTSCVYFRDHKNLLESLLPVYDNRDFLGSQDYSFEMSIYNAGSDPTYEVISLSSPETRGYVSFGLSIADPDAALSISATCDFDLTVNNDISPTNVSVTLIASDTLKDVAAKVQAEFDANDIYAWARVLNTGASWDLRVYSKSSGDYSTIDITAGSVDLATQMGGSYQTPIDGTSEWEIYQDSLTQGDWKATRHLGATVGNDFDPGTIGYALFSSMVAAGFDEFIVGLNNNVDFGHNSELYVRYYGSDQGYQELGLAGVTSSGDSTLSPLSDYYFGLSINGEASEEFAFTTTTDTTFAGVISSINSILIGRATLSIVSNDLRFTSDAYGPTSGIQTADGTTGTNLFGIAAFNPVSSHDAPVAGTGKLISIRPRRINAFTIISDSIKERAVYSHDDAKVYVTPDTETDIRDHIDTYHAYVTRTSADRWSTHNDRVIIHDLSSLVSWSPSATVTKTFTLTIGSDNYLLVGNSDGQIYFYKNGNLYDDDITLTDFTRLTSGSLGVGSESVNNFFVYDDTINSKKYLFVLTETYIYYADITSGLVAGTTFTAIDTNNSATYTFDPPTMYFDSIFAQIRDAESWAANVNSTTINHYLIFVGDSAASTWNYAPILYALYDTTAMTFTWYPETVYLNTQINNVSSIVKHNNWQDPEQDYQLFIANNANGPEIWTGNSQNSATNIGPVGDDRFARFSWIEPNKELGSDSLILDQNIDSTNFLEVYDSKIFTGGPRTGSSVFGGMYSYALKKVQKYFERDADLAYADPSGDNLYVTLSSGFLDNCDPAIAKISQEVDEGRAQLASTTELTTVSNWPSDSAFRLTLNGFNVGGIVYDGEYNVVFDGLHPDIFSIVDAINGSDLASAGLKTAQDVNHPPVTADLTPVLRARVLTELVKTGNTYTTRYKIVIESKTSAVGETSGHATPTETTQSDCYMTIQHPTTGSSVVGNGTNTLEIQPATIAYANLQMIDWTSAECYQVKRTSSGSLNFGGSSYISLASLISSGYKVLTGSFRVKSNATDEIGFSQGVGRILLSTTPITLAAPGNYTFKVEFDALGTPISDYVTIDPTIATTIQGLIDEINTDLTGGVASLQPLGSTAEYCDIVITSLTTGANSSVQISPSSVGTYLFGIEALSLTPNLSIQGFGAVAGSQTLGFTWENADYFIEYDHPTAHQVRLYIPNGGRLDPGATVWVDFWQYRTLTKIAAKVGYPPVNNTPTAGQWTYEIETKKIVLGSQPNITGIEDLIFVDLKSKKIISKLDLSDVVPSTQEDLSDKFHALQPRNLENSEIAVARSLARISALHYGVDLWGTDPDDQIVIDYSYFLPRLDVVAVRKQPDQYGNRVFEMLGVPNADTPFTEIPLVDQDEVSLLYVAYVNSQNYFFNNIVEVPWYLSSNINDGRIYLDGNSQYFRPEEALISDRGLAPIRKSVSAGKVVYNNDYKLVRTTDPVGVFNYRNRDLLYSAIDASQCIFLSKESGNDLNEGLTRNSPVQTLQHAIDLTTADRPYIIILKSVDTLVSNFASSVIDKSFKIYIVADYRVEVPQLTIASECYLQGLNVTTRILLQPGHNVEAKYCQVETFITDGNSDYPAGINLTVNNTIINSVGLEVRDDGSATHNITGTISVTFNHVYLRDSIQALYFNPNSYNTAADNKFTYNNITTSITDTGNIIECPHQVGISIEINNSVLPGDTVTRFASDAAISINRSLTYTITNTGTGAIVSTDSQILVPGQIDVHSDSGAPYSIARGDTVDSFALNYIDRHEDAGAYVEERIATVNDKEQVSSSKTFVHLDYNRVQYRYDLASDKFSFYIRFVPEDDFLTGGVLFDSRYDTDFNSDSGTFNKNGDDFFQIVYDNKTYETSYIDPTKYCFKFIMSNGSVTNIAIIGPYFTAENHSEYNQWHELSVLMLVEDTYNNKYSQADLATEDKERKQTLVFTMFDGLVDRVYAPTYLMFEDSSGNNIPSSKWYQGMVVSKYFNIGGGWTASWFSTPIGNQWSTWSEAKYHMTIDDFMVSRDIIPLNILVNFGQKEIIDLEYNNYRAGRWDGKESGIITHCNNPSPFSENGVHPSDDYYCGFRQYEGFEDHAIAVESLSPSLLAEGRITTGNWFDITPAVEWNSSATAMWSAQSGLNDNLIAVLNQRLGNLRVDFVDSETKSLSTSVNIVTGSVPSQAVMSKVGNLLVVAYIKADTKAYFKTVDSSYLVSSEFTINGDATDYLSVSDGHSSSEAIFTFHRPGASRGYIQIQNVSSGTIAYGPTEFGAGLDVSYSTATKSYDKDGNDTYTIFFREIPSNYLRFVMYNADLTSTVFVHNTISTTESPTDLKAKVFGGVNNIFIKYRDHNGGLPSPIMAALVSKEGEVVTPPMAIWGNGEASDLSNDLLFLPDSRLLFAIRDFSTHYLSFKMYDENLDELVNSPYLRGSNYVVGRVFLSTIHNSDNYAVSTEINNGSVDSGHIIVLDTATPTRWYKDFSGDFDYFTCTTAKTGSLFGYAGHITLNHKATLGNGYLWQPITLTSAGNQHFISGYFWSQSGSWNLILQGPALDNPIQINFISAEVNQYVHVTKGSDVVNYIKVKPINYNRIFRFEIGFVPDNNDVLNVLLSSTESADASLVDEFFVDNIKLEVNENPTSIKAEEIGQIEYPFNLKHRGSAFIRFTPEFFFDSSAHDHALFSAYATDESNTIYETHKLYYDTADQKFKFEIYSDSLTLIGYVESEEYGDAALVSQLTDLNEKHTIVCNWDVSIGLIEMFIDNKKYFDVASTVIDFKFSEAVIVGNSYDLSSAADGLFDLVRIADEPLTEIEILNFSNKIDPFVHPASTDIGTVNVTSLSFPGITSYDVLDRTIYTEKVGDAWKLVIDKGSNFNDSIVIRHNGVDIVTFESEGVIIDGNLQVTNLIAQTTTTISSLGDHITLRYGFLGAPLPTNDAYFEVERGTLTNSEMRWDESQQAWTFFNGTDNRISIDNRSIGTWKNNDDFDIDINGTGVLYVKTGTSPSDGSSVRAGGTERIRVTSTEVVFNDLGNVYDFRVESDSKPYAIYVSGSADKVLIGRVGGTATGATGDLIVNNAITVQYVDNTRYGQIEFRNNVGTLAGYIGYGDPTAGTPYWEIVSSGSNYLKISSDLELASGKFIRWSDDAVDTKMGYTSNATTQTFTGPAAYEGVYCNGNFVAYKVFNNVWNDYAEAFEFALGQDVAPGFVYKMTSVGLVKSNSRSDKAVIGVYSDTYGELMGAEGLYDEKTKTGNKIPIALAGKVKVWVREELEIGDVLVSDVDGFATKASYTEKMMSELIIGKVIEESKDNKPKRIWVLVK